MKIDQVKETIEKEIAALEESLYVFDKIVQPRAEFDKKLLSSLRADFIKVQTVSKKIEQGEKVSDEELMSVIPEQFR